MTFKRFKIFCQTESLSFLLLLLYTFSISFYQAFSSLLLLILFVVILRYNYKEFHIDKIFVAFLILFVIYSFSTFFSSSFNFKYLERKLSLLAIPLIFSNLDLCRSKYSKVFKVYTLGVIISIMVCLVNALIRSFSFRTYKFRTSVLRRYPDFFESVVKGGNHFFGEHFSIFHQTVYFGIFITIAIIILLYIPRLFKEKVKFMMLFLLLTALFLVSNKACFIACFLIFLIRFFTLKIKNNIKFLIIIVFISLGFFLIKINPRFNNAFNKAMNLEFEINPNSRYDFSTRILTWKASVDLIRESPIFGYGIADTQQNLNDYYKHNNFIVPLKEQLNTHNLFLQIWLESGIIALFVLIYIFFLFCRSGNFSFFNSYLSLSIAFSFLVVSLTESTFSRYSGISSFTFFACLCLKKIRQEFNC